VHSYAVTFGAACFGFAAKADIGKRLAAMARIRIAVFMVCFSYVEIGNWQSPLNPPSCSL
jgi:hypothetical protein